MTNFPEQKLIDKWKNKKAVVWEYKAPLGILILRLFTDSETKLLEITCINTTFLCGKLRWSDCNLQIESVNTEVKYSPEYRYILRDKKAEFKVYCSEIEIIEIKSIDL